MSEFKCVHCGSIREPITTATPVLTGPVELDQEDPQYRDLREFDPDGTLEIGLRACRDCHRIESFWIEGSSAPVRLDWGGGHVVGADKRAAGLADDRDQLLDLLRRSRKDMVGDEELLLLEEIDEFLNRGT